jgi:hypothetical protein
MAEMENALEAATAALDSAINNADAVDDAKLAAAVRAFEIRRLKSRHLAAAQAVSRSLSGVDEVLDKRGQQLRRRRRI